MIAELAKDISDNLDLRDKKLKGDMENAIRIAIQAQKLNIPTGLIGQKEMMLNVSEGRPMTSQERFIVMEELKVLMDKWGIQRMEARFKDYGQGINGIKIA